MKRPYDLVSFMQQEQRAEVLNQLKYEMVSKRFDETVDHVVEQTTAFDQVWCHGLFYRISFFSSYILQKIL